MRWLSCFNSQVKKRRPQWESKCWTVTSLRLHVYTVTSVVKKLHIEWCFKKITLSVRHGRMTQMHRKYCVLKKHLYFCARSLKRKKSFGILSEVSYCPDLWQGWVIILQITPTHQLWNLILVDCVMGLFFVFCLFFFKKHNSFVSQHSCVGFDLELEVEDCYVMATWYEIRQILHHIAR